MIICEENNDNHEFLFGGNPLGLFVSFGGEGLSGIRFDSM
jgi:hypothetical protein